MLLGAYAPLTLVYSQDLLLTVYALVGMALLCEAAEWWDEERRQALREAGSTATIGGSGLFGMSDPGMPVSFAAAMRVVVAGIVGLFAFLGLSSLVTGLSGGTSGSLGRNDLIANGSLVLAACALTAVMFVAGTERFPGLRGLRPGRAISWFAVLVVLQSFAQNLSPQSGTSTVATTIAKPEQATDLIVGSLPFGVIALLAVGPVVRRSGREWLERLGLLPLRVPWLLLGLVIGLIAVRRLDWLAGHINDWVPQPADCAAQQQQVSQSLTGGTSGRAWFANIAIALTAAVDEELLFRGVLQPRVGLVISSLLFASFHLQYTCHGLPSLGALEILLLGLLFGTVRKYGGVPAAILAHAAYDASILLNLTLGGPFSP